MRTTADRDAAVAVWLADSLNRPAGAREQWEEYHLAVLALGRRFSAVRLADDLVYAVAATAGPVTATAALRRLRGPVIHDVRGHRFYALVPPSPPSQSLGPYATYLGLGNYIGVPRVGDAEPVERLAAYWVVPMATPGALCDPMQLADLIETGTAILGVETTA
ncbi:hypothetical protein DWB77_05347 [Streptomyces hundungensis]|uniref:DNA primase/polymerase bifunctional N-terminal domain-containing protein n=1 Tax=Streptomyces hundungensis TaxID=1077946 RepID=A0A387HKB4_9ACTN|nr:hypothetical protein [Streptomyces hundungensis]AYG83151.1 hypothetical protein DWB77_05347 [Streptomyces hundungensis]